MAHWGIQYYLEEGGLHCIDVNNPAAEQGDLIIVPYNQPVRKDLNSDRARPIAQLTIPASAWITTMHPQLGAGFYASMSGPLPYAFGPVPAEEYWVFAVNDYREEGKGTPPLPPLYLGPSQDRQGPAASLRRRPLQPASLTQVPSQ